MSRRPFTVTKAMRQKVRELAGVGVPQDIIANIVGCAPKTLRKHLREELTCGAAEATAKVVGFLFAAAEKGNVTAQIFWLKTRAGWREAGPPDRSASSASTDDAGTNSRAVVVLPDNERDPELTEVLKKAQEEYVAKKRRDH
jgi:hypothetical protein